MYESTKGRIFVQCGKTTDSFEELETLCKREAEKLSETMEIPSQSVITVTFWTTDFPELIGVGSFYKDERNAVRYDLDFSETTL